jgi:hypothetical protein
MPSYGETQKAAGVNRPCGCALLQDKKIPCRNVKLHCDPKLYDVPYKGNAVLNANK